MQRRAFDAQATEIRWMSRVPAHAGDTRAIGLDDDAAADAAVTAGGLDLWHGSAIATDVPETYVIQIMALKPDLERARQNCAS